MRVDNLVLTAICVPAIVASCWFAWSGRNLRLRPPGCGFQEAFDDVVAALGAGAVSGLLAAGLGGRFVMRFLAVTSGDSVQGRLTDAEQVVGRITFDGTFGLVLFVGLLIPTIAAATLLIARPWLPTRAWHVGIVTAALAIGTVGISDPLSRRNSDYHLLSPTWLAITLVAGIGLLFGLTFAGLWARFGAAVRPLDGHPPSKRSRLLYVSLIVLINPATLALSAVYLIVATAAGPRVRATLGRPFVRRIGHGAVLAASAVFVWRIGREINAIV